MAKVSEKSKSSLESGDYYTWLALAVRLLRPQRLLELGNSEGASTIMIYSELTAETEFFFSVDQKRNISFVPESIFSDPRVKFVFGNDLNLSVYGAMLPVGLDFLFIDTLHCYKQISDEWKIYKNLCKPNSIVVLDDILMNDMPKFWAELPYPKLDISEGFHESGFGFFVYKPETEQSSEYEKIKDAYVAALEIAYGSIIQKEPSFISRCLRYAKTKFKKF
jgi:hypothetical protein